MKRDTLYTNQTPEAGTFAFDESVAEVFTDMIGRSVPGYHAMLQALKPLISSQLNSGGILYDLGCSLGATTEVLLQATHGLPYEVIGIDNSQAMINRCQQSFAKEIKKKRAAFFCCDLTAYPLKEASAITMNYVLQFTPPRKRKEIIARMYRALKPGGLFILSEKVKLAPGAQKLFTAAHEQFKHDQGYSHLEISRKRQALENVLISESLSTHLARLRRVGFSTVVPWLQFFQFSSIVAIK